MRGEKLTKYNPVNKILFGQWGDNKIVSFISILPQMGKETVNHKCGRDVKTFECPSPLCAYKCFMGYVDLVDHDKKLEEDSHIDLILRSGTKKFPWCVGFHVGEWQGSMEYVL